MRLEKISKCQGDLTIKTGITASINSVSQDEDSGGAQQLPARRQLEGGQGIKPLKERVGKAGGAGKRAADHCCRRPAEIAAPALERMF